MLVIEEIFATHAVRAVLFSPFDRRKMMHEKVLGHSCDDRYNSTGYPFVELNTYDGYNRKTMQP
jgi:hypothetical protein